MLESFFTTFLADFQANLSWNQLKSTKEVLQQKICKIDIRNFTITIFCSVYSYSSQKPVGFYLSAFYSNMKFFIVSLVILLNLFSNITSILQCFVKENSSNEQKQCIFPFTLVTDPDVVYNECTKIHDSFGKYWCSTKVSDRFCICLLKSKLPHMLGLNFMSG